MKFGSKIQEFVKNRSKSRYKDSNNSIDENLHTTITIYYEDNCTYWLYDSLGYTAVTGEYLTEIKSSMEDGRSPIAYLGERVHGDGTKIFMYVLIPPTGGM